MAGERKGKIASSSSSIILWLAAKVSPYLSCLWKKYSASSSFFFFSFSKQKIKDNSRLFKEEQLPSSLSLFLGGAPSITSPFFRGDKLQRRKGRKGCGKGEKERLPTTPTCYCRFPNLQASEKESV